LKIRSISIKSYKTECDNNSFQPSSKLLEMSDVGESVDFVDAIFAGVFSDDAQFLRQSRIEFVPVHRFVVSIDQMVAWN